MRGDQRGRGTQLEYDRKGKYSLSLERQFYPDRHILFQGDCLYIILYVTLRCSNDGRIWQYDNSCVCPWHRAREVRAILASFHFTSISYLRILN